MELKKAVVDY